MITLIYIIIIVAIFLLLRSFYRTIKFKFQTYITKDTTILITGGCFGIGRELINIFIKKYGCKIINFDVREKELKELSEEFTDKIINIYYDITKIDDIISFLKERNINPDDIDIVINNAGIAYNKALVDLNQKQMIKTIDVNLLAPMKFIKGFIDNKISKNNKEKTLHFVTMCSEYSHSVAAKSSDYIASKWGVFAFMECVRNEYLYSKELFFTSICPFAINTGMFHNFNSMLVIDKYFLSDQIVKCIALKEKVKFFPWYSYVPILIYKLFPMFLNDLMQYYYVNRLMDYIGRREDTDKQLDNFRTKEKNH